MKCQLLMTGNELMTGVTIDSNSTYLAEKLYDIGISVTKKITIGDSLQQLENEILNSALQTDLLIINGGLGPTVDDLTAQALATVCHSPLKNNPAAEEHVRYWCRKRGISPNAANLKQALLPDAASVIANPVGSAVGIAIEYKRHAHTCLILCTPGVPSEMRLMMEQEILPLLKKRFPDSQEQFIKRLQIFGMGESFIQHKITTEIPDWPNEIELGFRAGLPSLEVKLTAYNKVNLKQRDLCEQQLRTLIGHHIYGEESDTLWSIVVAALKDRGKKITLAESCTGGLIASMITSVPGSSQIFEAGFVTYANNIKHSVLDVDMQALINFGAVSEQVVVQMAQGAIKKSNADYVIAVSGIAGPDGGTEDKPVGTVWIAWGKTNRIKSHKLFYPVERKMFQTLVAAYALDLIRREILEIDETPRYLKK